MFLTNLLNIIQYQYYLDTTTESMRVGSNPVASRGHSFSTYAPNGGGAGASQCVRFILKVLLFIYKMRTRGREGVKNVLLFFAYVLNGWPPTRIAVQTNKDRQ